MTRTTTKRLTRSDWLIAGLDAVIEAGPDALKAEPLARRLGTTKGSFYWHFTDVPAFHAALLSAWELQTNADLIAAVTQETTPAARLRALGQAIADQSRGQAADASIRAWARGNKSAAQSVARVDAKRLAHIEELLLALDVTNREMARIIYAAGIGIADLVQAEPGENADTMGSLVDLILALR